jgi:CRP-like cAMP-binding protein
MLTPGNGFRIAVSAFQNALPSTPELTRMLLRRLAIRSVELAQNAACNRLHSVKQRIARLFLSMHNRIDSDLISTTHEAVSKMVGTDRPTVSIALAALEQDGLMKCGHASISITDRENLEKQTCGCYLISKRFDAELGLRS